MATLIRVDKNGTKYYSGMVTCDRCGGYGGADAWRETGWTCYKCGGTGKVAGKWKEYTPEYEAKLEARREARRKKWEEEHAEEIAQREAERKAEEERREAERKAREEEEKAREARKAISKHIGTVGDKLQMECTLEYSASFEVRSFSGFGMDTMHIHGFRDDEGNLLIWNTSKPLGIEKGSKVNLKGTIKEHSEYKDEKQTVLTRCKVEQVEEA